MDPNVSEEQVDEPLQEGEVQATPEEQAQLEALVAEADRMIHAPGKIGDDIAAMVLNSTNITEGIGRATATVVIGLEKKVGQIPEDFMLPLAQEVMAELAGLAVEAGALAEDEVTAEWIDEAVSHAYSNYLSTKEAMGELDQDKLKSSVAEAGQMVGNVEQKQAQKPSGLLGHV